MVDIQDDTFEMDYDLLEQAITEKTKVIIPVEFAGIVCDYDRLFQDVEKKRDLFVASSKWQKAFKRIVIVSSPWYRGVSRKLPPLNTRGCACCLAPCCPPTGWGAACCTTSCPASARFWPKDGCACGHSP